LSIALERTIELSQDTAGALGSRQQLVMHDLLPPSVWMARVANAVEMIQQGALQKVVLARAVQMSNEEQSFDIYDILRRLYQNYPTAYVFAIQRDKRYFVGATPERLICGVDGQIQTMALAGSAPRGATEE